VVPLILTGARGGGKKQELFGLNENNAILSYYKEKK
jgi:hypothetical protein